MADVHPFGNRVTPPLSPSSPLPSQGVLCRVDQVPHTVGNIVSCILPSFLSNVARGEGCKKQRIQVCYFDI